MVVMIVTLQPDGAEARTLAIILVQFASLSTVPPNFTNAFNVL